MLGQKADDVLPTMQADSLAGVSYPVVLDVGAGGVTVGPDAGVNAGSDVDADVSERVMQPESSPSLSTEGMAIEVSEGPSSQAIAFQKKQGSPEKSAGEIPADGSQPLLSIPSVADITSQIPPFPTQRIITANDYYPSARLVSFATFVIGRFHRLFPISPICKLKLSCLRYLQRMVMDQSVATGLLEHMFSDASTFEVVGYIGGSIRRVPDLSLPPMQYTYFAPGTSSASLAYVPGEVIVTYVTHFFPCERTMEGMLSGELKETQTSYQNCLAHFKKVGVECVGWYRSNNPMKQPIPSKSDVMKQSQMQRLHPCSLGIIMSLTSSNRPSRFFPEVAEPAFGSPLVAPIHSLTAFRAYSEMITTETGEMASGSAAEEILVAVYEQALPDPALLESSVKSLSISLKESIEAYELLVGDASQNSPLSHNKQLLDSEFGGFMNSFWRYGVIDTVQNVDHSFNKLARAKALVSSWIDSKMASLREAFQTAATSLGVEGESQRFQSFEEIVSELSQRYTDRSSDPVSQTLSRLVTTLSAPIKPPIAPSQPHHNSVVTIQSNASSYTSGPRETPTKHRHQSLKILTDALPYPDAHNGAIKRVRRTRKDKGEKRKQRNSKEDHIPARALSLVDASDVGANASEPIDEGTKEPWHASSGSISELMVKTANSVNGMMEDGRDRLVDTNPERFAVAMRV
ncbi:hypothetical protein HDU67_003645 [Dinochytrium kinnereticum]|nr:hypothetical protein HDU67_003645 [Dinochytrium kinnereticum]